MSKGFCREHSNDTQAKNHKIFFHLNLTIIILLYGGKFRREQNSYVPFVGKLGRKSLFCCASYNQPNILMTWQKMSTSYVSSEISKNTKP